MAARELPEIRYASRGRLIETELRKTAREQDRKSNVRQRQIDRTIYLTAQELNDIQTRTPSPTACASRSRTQAAKIVTPRITVTDADASPHDNGDPSFHSPRAIINTNTNNSSSDHDSSDSEISTHLVHLRARTRRNLLLSQKLSRSLEVMDEKRAQSSRPPPSASRERGAYRPVSCRSMEDLQRAAAVLRFTEHETMVQQLLSSVSLKEKVADKA